MDTILYRLLGFVIAIAIMFFAMKAKRLDFKETLALNNPKAKDMLLYLGIFIAWVTLTEFILYKLNMLETGQWKEFSNGHIILRGISICVIAPIAEELIFRGLLFSRVRDRFGLKAAFILPAALFALLHLKLDGEAFSNVWVLITFIDALYYSFVRYKSNSIYITILLHALGNTIALVEKLI